MLDAEGIDISVMYPGLGLKLGGIEDPELAVWSCRVYNDWVAEWCAAAPERLKGTGALPLQDPAAAADETRRIKDLGLVGTFVRPNAYNGVPFHEKLYTPVWEALEETGLTLGLHITGLADMPGAARGMGPLMAPGTHHALIPVIDQMVTLSNLDLRRRAGATPGPEGGGARERWRVDRPLDGPPQRVRGELPLGRRTDDAHRRGVLPAAVLDQLRSRGAHGEGARPSDRPRSDDLGVGLPPQRRQVPRRARRAPGAQRRPSRKPTVVPCTALNVCDLYDIAV